jgi:hypothetical protein
VATSIAAGTILLTVALGGTVGLDRTLSAATRAPEQLPSVQPSPAFVDDHHDHDGHGHGG